MTKDITLFDYSPITERRPIHWPYGKRVAFYIGLNIEHFYVDLPGTTTYESTATLIPDALNYGWRDYGPRVGIWRQIELLDKHGIRASALLNSDVGHRYPQIITAGGERGWAWLAHGSSNSHLHTGFTVERERVVLRDIISTIEETTGRRPRGWMGPGLTETFTTPELLAELGIEYLLDWTNDDQPYRLTSVPSMLSVPYSVELNDIGIFVTKGLTGPDFVQMVKDQCDQLYADSVNDGRVMALALHPFVSGQAFRHRYLDEALEYVVNHPGVWTTTTDEIVDHYRQTTGDPSL